MEFSERTALKIIAVVAFVGFLFSGYLSYTELYAKTGTLTCGASSFSLFGFPSCIYGFTMYLIIFAASAAGLLMKRG